MSQRISIFVAVQVSNFQWRSFLRMSEETRWVVTTSAPCARRCSRARRMSRGICVLVSLSFYSFLRTIFLLRPGGGVGWMGQMDTARGGSPPHAPPFRYVARLPLRCSILSILQSNNRLYRVKPVRESEWRVSPPTF